MNRINSMKNRYLKMTTPACLRALAKANKIMLVKTRVSSINTEFETRLERANDSARDSLVSGLSLWMIVDPG
jgi:hypothetical protein